MRLKVVKLKGDVRKYSRTKRRPSAWAEVDERMADMASGAAKVNHSRYWGVRFGVHQEPYGPVSVYAPDGSLLRVIPKEALDRPFPRDTRKSAWNNPLFTPGKSGL